MAKPHGNRAWRTVVTLRVGLVAALAVVLAWVLWAGAAGSAAAAVTEPSRLCRPGPSGNVEYFLWLRADTDRALLGDDLDAAIRTAVDEGPQ